MTWATRLELADMAAAEAGITRAEFDRAVAQGLIRTQGKWLVSVEDARAFIWRRLDQWAKVAR